MVDGHAALNPPDDGGWFVIGKIDLCFFPQLGKDTGQSAFIGQQFFIAGPPDHIGVADIGHELVRHFLGRKNEISHTRRYGCPGHAVEFACGIILDHDHAAVFLDCPDTPCTVTAGSGQYHGNGPFRLIFCKGAQEDINGQIHPSGIVFFL